jgi:hypothetical protein
MWIGNILQSSEGEQGKIMGEISQAEIEEWLGRSSRIFIKKLSRNDCSWADDRSKHQNGFYIPQEIGKSDYFPPLLNVNKDKPHILMADIPTLWPVTGEVRESSLRHFTNKGSEMHFTRVPRCEFANLTPASLLLGGKLKSPIHGIAYWFIALDSQTEEAEIVESAFDLKVDFHSGLFDPISRLTPIDELEDLIREIDGHLRSGTLHQFVASVAKLPKPEVFAQMAQQSYLEKHGLAQLNPFEMTAPGDAVMEISRDIEYAHYKRAELRHRAAEVIRIVTGGGPDIVSAIVRGFPQLDATFLSASQHRKSRAGRSFEQHIACLLKGGGIIYEEQAVTGGRRPDFVLPGISALKSSTAAEDALILSAKTTLRERWKQIAMEKFNCDLFLATVDDRVSPEAIEDMARQNICLIVPESLKNSDESSYKKKNNVITFKNFFDQQILEKRKGLILASSSLF